MYKNFLGWLAVVLMFPSCSSNSPAISVVCEENSVGNCIIRWETTPAIQGKVNIYASTNPNKIPERNPVMVADISDQRVTIVTIDPTVRYYYKMVFNNRYRVKTASRNTVIPEIQNFRDIGGYLASKGKRTRWGMLYRAGKIDDLSYSAHRELKNIGIKTIVDLRSQEELGKANLLESDDFQVIHLPIGTANMSNIIRDLREDKIRNDSIYRLLQNINRDLVTHHRDEYKKLFDILLEEKNYPVVIHCTTGKGRTAIASALILAALGVSDDVIMYDYRLNNKYFDIPQASNFGYSLSVNSQEAITTLFSAREGFINAAKNQIEKNYGDIPTYLERGLGLTQDDIKHLRSMLLE